MFTVKQLAKLAGITPRTLHYYDEVGLLKPTQLGGNGYRYYGEAALLQLQQILLYRELDLSIDEIKKIMGRPDFDILAALEGHKSALSQRIVHMQRLVATVEHTILHLKGHTTMSNQQLFEPFNEAQQAEYEQAALREYDPEIVKASMKKWKGYTAADKQRIGDEGNAVYRDMVAAMPKGAASPEAQACVARWRQHMNYFWTPNLDQLVALAKGYYDDPRFKANFDKIHPDLAAFMGEAVAVYVARAN
ncbi:MAG: MerR family transcriptional regulator [Anaerolineae bacterium]|nr:MerR family transcriptional regulator [Anaerolineae bacterium]